MKPKKPAEVWVIVGATRRGNKRAKDTVDAPEDAETCGYYDDWAAPESMDTTEYQGVNIAVPESLDDNDLEMIEVLGGDDNRERIPQLSNRF